MKFKKWNIGAPPEQAVALLQSAGYPYLLSTVLAARGITTAEAAAEALERDRSLSLSPMLMRDMDRAAARIQRAISQGETIAVFGDYDVDGITSTVLLMDYLKSCGAKCLRHIPRRIEEGYGLSRDAIQSLRDQGFTELYPPEKKRWYCKVPVFSFSKLSGLDAYLSPEMKSTGEAIGYDDRLPYALYKAMQAAGMKLQDHGTVLLSICPEDLEEALPLVGRFYRLGFNIEATTGTAQFLKDHGIRTRVRRDYTEDPAEITGLMRSGRVAYIINTRDLSSSQHVNAGVAMRRLAIENNLTTFTSLDTVRALLDVLEAVTSRISTIDE